MKGSVRVRNGTLYAVISYKDNLGQYKQKWISTGLKERGNKKQAQKILETELENLLYTLLKKIHNQHKRMI